MLFPLKDNELVAWLNQFAIAFELHAAKLGFTQRDVLGTRNDAAMFHYLVGIEVPAYEIALSKRKDYKQMIKYGNTCKSNNGSPRVPSVVPPPAEVEPGIVPRLHDLVLRIKSLPNCTPELCKEFGLPEFESESGVEPATAKPSGRAIGQPENEVRVEFTKGAFDGVLIESRRTGEDEWCRLAIDNFSPYIDSRPLVRCGKPEVREYRMRFLLSDEPVGEWSDILVATASR